MVQSLNPKRKFTKVFELGSPKTGTKSLGAAFDLLGLKHKSWDLILHEQCKRGDFKETLRIAEMYEAFEDTPWHSFDLYKRFDILFPKSKFILLERQIDEWIQSHENFFSYEINSKEAHPLYLIEDYQSKRDQIIKDHQDKYKKIKSYFKHRQDDLLVMNICAGEGWEKLCPFLGLPVPKTAFPHLNKSKDK